MSSDISCSEVSPIISYQSLNDACNGTLKPLFQYNGDKVITDSSILRLAHAPGTFHKFQGWSESQYRCGGYGVYHIFIVGCTVYV